MFFRVTPFGRSVLFLLRETLTQNLRLESYEKNSFSPEKVLSAYKGT